MAKYCQKCGTQLDEDTNLCPKCDAKKIKRINKQQKKSTKKKKSILCIIIPIVLLLIAGIGLGVGLYIFKDDIQSLFSSKQYDEDNVGEIYCQEIDEEHVANIDENISYADNEILIVANDGISYSKVEKLAKEYDASIVGYIEQTGDYQLELNDTYTIDELEDLIEQLENEDIIASASVNYITELSEDSIHYGEEWSEDIKSDSTTGISWNIKASNTYLAWLFLDALDDSCINPVRVGLIDNGFDSDHEDLGFAEVFYNDDFDVDNESSHGTHVAGTMAASSSDDTGICGIYPYGEGNLYGVSYTGISNTDKVSTMGYNVAFAELIFRNVKVINVSRGWVYNDYEDVVNHWDETKYASYINKSNALADFLQRALDKGFDFVIACSAGNKSGSSSTHLESKYNSPLTLISEEDYPDVYNRIIVVGAINSSYEVANYSNGGQRTDIYAPGGESNSSEEGYKIYSTISNNEYGYKKGTSMATPHVSGVAAIVWSLDSSLTGEEVKDIILSNTVAYDQIQVLNAFLATMDAYSSNENVENSDVEYGGLFAWLVNDENDDEISDALITVTNSETGESESTTSNTYGHFELILSPGEYTVTITADGYEDYTLDSITITSGEINYIGDWIRMTPTDESSNNSSSLNPLNIPSDAKEYNGHYYMIYSKTQTWSEAKTLCEELGGHLVTITSQEEQDFIAEYNASSSYLWIGGYREDDGDTWMWVTGETWNYNNWRDDEPDNSSNVVPNENRIVLWSDNTWNDLNDENTYESSGYICEWDSALYTN